MVPAEEGQVPQAPWSITILFNCSTSIFFIKSMLTYNYAKLMLTMPILAAQPRSACLSTNRSKGQARQPAAAS